MPGASWGTPDHLWGPYKKVPGHARKRADFMAAKNSQSLYNVSSNREIKVHPLSIACLGYILTTLLPKFSLGFVNQW